MPYQHLNVTEREKIQDGLRAEKPLRSIAEDIGRPVHPSSYMKNERRKSEKSAVGTTASKTKRFASTPLPKGVKK